MDDVSDATSVVDSVETDDSSTVTPQESATTVRELLTQFLERTALHAQIDDMTEGEASVSLMTVHSAKGLEFKTVFVAGFDEGLFPGMRSMDDPEQMEEERRLAYVAITRAREKLYLTTARSRLLFGRTQGYMPSRFLAEIPRETLHVLGLASASTAVSSQDRYSSSQSRRGTSTGSYGERPTVGQQSRPERSSVGTPKQTGPSWKRVARPANRGAASRMPATTLSVTDIKKGDNVVHPKFGRGVILQIEAVAGDAILKIRFDGSGEKRLLLNSAGLSKG